MGKSPQTQMGLTSHRVPTEKEGRHPAGKSCRGQPSPTRSPPFTPACGLGPQSPGPIARLGEQGPQAGGAHLGKQPQDVNHPGRQEGEAAGTPGQAQSEEILGTSSNHCRTRAACAIPWGRGGPPAPAGRPVRASPCGPEGKGPGGRATAHSCVQPFRKGAEAGPPRSAQALGSSCWPAASAMAPSLLQARPGGRRRNARLLWDPRSRSGGRSKPSSAAKGRRTSHNSGRLSSSELRFGHREEGLLGYKHKAHLARSGAQSLRDPKPLQ